jgi:hypothetical protein
VAGCLLGTHAEAADRLASSSGACRRAHLAPPRSRVRWRPISCELLQDEKSHKRNEHSSCRTRPRDKREQKRPSCGPWRAGGAS